MNPLRSLFHYLTGETAKARKAEERARADREALAMVEKIRALTTAHKSEAELKALAGSGAKGFVTKARAELARRTLAGLAASVASQRTSAGGGSR